MCLSKTLSTSVCFLCILPSSESRADLHAVVEAAKNRNVTLKSFFVKYQVKSKVIGNPADAKMYMNILAEVDETKIYAYKGNKRYYRLMRSTASYVDIAPDVPLGTTPELSLPKGYEAPPEGAKTNVKGLIEVAKDTETAFDGMTLRRRNRGDNQAFIFSQADAQTARSDIQFFSNEYLWLVFHAMPDVFKTADTRGQHRLPDALQSGRAELLPESEVIDGHECLVIKLHTNPQEILWCDPKLNYAVRRWDRFEKNTTHRTWSYELSDFEEVVEGCWFPRHCARLRWATTTAPEKIRETPLMHYQYNVVAMRANDVPDDLFTLSFPAGTEVIDFENLAVSQNGVEQPLFYTMPADGNDLDKTIERHRSMIENSSVSIQPTPSKLWLWINLLVVLALAVFIFLRRRYRKC